MNRYKWSRFHFDNVSDRGLKTPASPCFGDNMTARPSSCAEVAGVAELIETLRNRVQLLENELVSASAEMQYRSDIEALVAHEIRTPLTVLRGALDALQSGRLDDVGANELIAAAARHARRACTTVDHLLEAGPRARIVERTALEPVVFGELVVDVVSGLEDTTGPLDVTVNGAAVTFMSSRARLRAIMTNLLSNATKVSPSEAINCNARFRRHTVRFEVCDRGAGTPVPKLMFERSTGNDDRRVSGLFVVGMLAESLAGKSGIRARRGGGSIAWCELPLRRHDDRHRHADR